MLSKHPPYNPVPYRGKLTIANAITDVTRLAGVEGDGAAYPDSSVGVWPAATNLFSGKNRSSNSGANLVVTLNSSEYPIFGGVSDKCVSAGVGTGEGVAIDQSADVSAATTYTWSIFGVFPAGSTLRLRATERDASDVNIGNVGTVNFVGTGALQRVTFTGATTTGVKARVVIETITTAQALTWYVAGWQLEAGSIATPFTTASRSVGRIQAPVSGIFTTTQGWFFMRTKMGFGNASALPVAAPGIMCWSDSTNERIHPFVGIGGWSMRRQTGGSGTDAAISGAWASGDAVSLCGAWTSTAVKGSTNGAAFTSAANATIPTVARSTFDIANNTEATDRPLCASNYWFAAGKGTLTDADAALFHAWGNNDPLPHMFPKSARLSFLAHFNGDGTFCRRSA